MTRRHGTTRAARRLFTALLGLLLWLSPSGAQAQGSSASVRQFGAWLDDASAPVAGDGQMTVAVGQWRMPGVTQTNLPILATGLAVSDRMQVSASLPFYRMTAGGATSGGMDNVYLGAKYNLVDPTISLNEMGLAVGTVMEVLSAGTDGGRVHFVVPVSVEWRRAPFRWYGTAGYFSRGAFFTGGAVEWTSPHGVSVTGTLTDTRSTQANPSLDALGVSRRRLDVSAGAGYPIGSRAAAFVNVARSVNGGTNSSDALALTGGVSFWFRAAAVTP